MTPNPLHAQILEALDSGPRSLRAVAEATGASIGRCRSAIKALRAEARVVKVGDKRGATYGLPKAG